MSKQTHILLAVLSAVLIAVLVLTGFTLHRTDSRPDIQGKWIEPARELSGFQLTDHDRNAFSPADLQGRWHLVAYGFTHCPDICPSALAGLSSLLRQVDTRTPRFGDLDILFYSVDPHRDTPEHLAEYIAFFNTRLTGLTLTGHSQEAYRNFEQTLGIEYDIPDTDRFGDAYPDDDYPVVHGVNVFLINPDAELQARLTPEHNEQGMVHFSVEQLYQDYTAIREYLEGEFAESS